MKHSILIPRFDGGMNVKAAPTQLLPHEASAATNCIFDDFGSVDTRPDIRAYNTVAISGATSIDGIWSIGDSGSTPDILVATNKQLYIDPSASQTFNSVSDSTNVFSGGVTALGAMFRDRLIITDGGTQPYKFVVLAGYNQVTRAGVSAPSNPVALTRAATGITALNGTYYYKFTLKNSFSVESDIGASSVVTTTTGTWEQVTISSFPTYVASFGVTSWNVYRTTAGASTSFWLVTSVTNGTTSYVDKTPDASLVTAAPTDNAPPPYFVGVLVHQSRMFGFTVDSSDLWYSEIDNPETYPSTNFIRIASGDDMHISGIQEIDEGILIQKNNRSGEGRLFKLVTPTSTATDWSVIRTDSMYGGEARSAMVPFKSSVAFVNRFGIYEAIKSASGDKVMIENISFKIEPIIKALTTSIIKDMKAIVYRNKIYFLLTTDQILVYDFLLEAAGLRSEERGAWSYFDISGGSLGLRNMVVHNDKLLAGGAAGFVYEVMKASSYTADQGLSPVQMQYNTGFFHGKDEHSNNMKIWRHVYLLVEALSNTSTLTYVNEYGQSQSSNFSSTPTVGGSTRQRVKINVDFSAVPASRYLQLQFYSGTRLKLHSAEIEYTLKGKRQ